MDRRGGRGRSGDTQSLPFRLVEFRSELRDGPIQILTEADTLKTHASHFQRAGSIQLRGLVSVLWGTIFAPCDRVFDESGCCLQKQGFYWKGERKWLEKGSTHLSRKFCPFSSSDIVHLEGLVRTSVIPRPFVIVEAFCAKPNFNVSDSRGTVLYP